MTGITRPVVRESSATVYSQGRRRPIVVILRPGDGLVRTRLKGTRTEWGYPIDALYRESVRAELARQKAERKKARAAK